MRFKDLSIRAKLLGGFALVLAIALGQSITAMNRLGAVNDHSNDIADNWLPSVRVLGEMNADMSDLRVERLKLLVADTGAAAAETLESMRREQAGMEAHRNDYAKLIDSPEERTLFEAFDAKWTAWRDLQPELVRLQAAHDAEGMKALLAGAGNKAYLEADAALDALVELNVAGSRHASASADRIFDNARLLLWSSLAAMVAAGLAIGWIVSGSVVRAARQAIECASRVAEGDLSREIDTDGRDEMGQLLAALATMQQRLREIVAGVRGSAEGVACASTQIAQGNLDLSSRTEEQASALQQTAASMEQLSGSVTHNAGNAGEANRLAREASGVAASGGQVVARVVETMKNIDESSRRINDIIGVIDGIAFQTNILALNAAVEAARAGEQGRGFAVVAGEVRALAQRSAEAAKQIKALIGTSVERVQQGSRLVDEAGATMQAIVGSIQRVSDIVGEIAHASAEQSTGLGQIGDAITQIDQTTQQNAALVEESAAAAESLRTQSASLVQAVSVFSLAPA